VLLSQVREVLEPLLAQRGVPWARARCVLRGVQDSPAELRRVLENAQQFAQVAVASAGPAARQALAEALRPKLEAALAQRCAQWDGEVCGRLIELVDSTDDLKKALSENAGDFVDACYEGEGAEAKLLLVQQLGGSLGPHLASLRPPVGWSDAQAALRKCSVAQLRAALADPQALLRELLGKRGGPPGRALVLARMRPALTRALQAHAVPWEAAEGILALETDEGLRAGASKAAQYLDTLGEGGGHAARQLLVASTRAGLEPALAARGIAWEEGLRILEHVHRAEDLEDARDAPMAWVKKLAEHGGWGTAEGARGMLVAQLRKPLQPLLDARGVAWPAMAQVLAEVPSLEELRAALAEPRSFLDALSSGEGRETAAGRRLVVAQLQAELEAPLLGRDVAWECGAHVLLTHVPPRELAALLDELRDMSSDAAGRRLKAESYVRDIAEAPQTLQELEAAEAAVKAGEAERKVLLDASRWLIYAQLRPRLEPLLAPRGLPWDETDEVLGHGVAWHGMAWHGTAWHGTAWHGMAWHGMAWHGAPGTEGGSGRDARQQPSSLRTLAPS
jgi:hypothetical protein